MTEPKEGPYVVGQCGNIMEIDSPDNIVVADIDPRDDMPLAEREATARLLAASWEMKELIKAVGTALDTDPRVCAGDFLQERLAMDAILKKIDTP